jgi:hypothetical protein
MALPYLYPSTFPYGARAVTFIFGGVASATASVILESFEMSEPTTELNRQNATGAPNGFALIAEPRTATATAQLATSAVTYIRVGDTSSFSPYGTAVGQTTAITWVVTQSGSPEGNREVKKQSLTLREEI